jgi:hypothetical protein
MPPDRTTINLGTHPVARVLFLSPLLCLGLAGVCRADASTAAVRGRRLDLAVRLGQGGFRDGRSPIGKLGGGQLARDVRPHRFPIAFSLTLEYYTNGPDPTHSYEIAGLTAVNVLLVRSLGQSRRVHAFLGGGAGTLAVPRGDDGSRGERVRGIVFNVEGGLRFRVYRAFGVYGMGKYLRAQKSVAGRRVIDFNEGIVLLGLCAEFGL